MDEIKRCTRCGKTKSGDEFYRRRSGRRKGKLRPWCKICEREYGSSSAGKAAKRKYNCSQAGQIARRRYEHSEKGKRTKKEYLHTSAGRKSRAQAAMRHRRLHPNRYKARYAVIKAVRSGKLEPASQRVCECCGEQAEHYHHPDYSKPLDVTPLCEKCHRKVHNA